MQGKARIAPAVLAPSPDTSRLNRPATGLPHILAATVSNRRRPTPSIWPVNCSALSQLLLRSTVAIWPVDRNAWACMRGGPTVGSLLLGRCLLVETSKSDQPHSNSASRSSSRAKRLMPNESLPSSCEVKPRPIRVSYAWSSPRQCSGSPVPRGREAKLAPTALLAPRPGGSIGGPRNKLLALQSRPRHRCGAHVRSLKAARTPLPA